jgi:hypothetical protein
MRTLMFFCMFLAAAMPAAAAEYVVGDLAITYDPARWSFSRLQEGDPLVSRPDTFLATCIGCRGAGMFVGITAADIEREESDSVLDPMWSRDKRQSSMTVGELTVGITTIHSPCRNWVPPSITAKVAYRGKYYSFHSGSVVGCRGVSGGVGQERFEELLRGLHPREG